MDSFLKKSARLFKTIFYYQADTTDNIDNKWDKLPTVSEYIVQYPEHSDAANETIKCRFCSSSNIKFQPLMHSRDRREKHFCGACKRTLYKSFADV
ncbi:hypothetical protein [Psychromonas sp. Urea-02u-13]|uniref:hypothetical protein n=1 Tax=Psychromonas sp. Urea-02u-13 TaxID=2058326 RepID=UPI000C343CEE|nr:hypothetical protein [Psychromonas sp. Urea-02u-13]PKG39092.1 hypothetical protein CXF74_10355 [Psychromonas sp. Urea-02u-13]